MKINTTPPAGATLPTGETRVRNVGGGQSQVGAPGEKVELSSLSASMLEAEQAMAEVPAVDPNKVAEMKQAISDGTFEVDAEKVADGLIESARQMLDAQGHKA